MKVTHAFHAQRVCTVLAAIAACTLHGAAWSAPASDATHEAGAAPQACGDAPLADFNMRISFSLLNGACVPQVHLLVRDHSGAVVIERESRGAPVYARVPPGTYVVIARYGTQRSVQRFTIGGPERGLAHFSWPAANDAGSHNTRPPED